MAELRKPGMDDGGTGRALGSSGMHAALREGMAEEDRKSVV